MEIHNAFPKEGFNKFPANIVQCSDFKANAPSFDAIGLCSTGMVMVGDEGSTERMFAENATAEMSDVLGLKPARIDPIDALRTD